METYEVRLTFRYPAWDEKHGIPYEVQADSKSEAIRKARSEAERDGHVPCRGKGKATFTANIAR